MEINNIPQVTEHVMFSMPVEGLKTLIKEWLKEAITESSIVDQSDAKKVDFGLTINQVLEVSGLSRTTLYHLLASKQLKSYNIGRSVRISREALNEFLDKRKGLLK